MRKAMVMSEPNEGEIVFVQGGVAQYRGGVFYTGMEDPRYERPIQWPVTWWAPIDRDPRRVRLGREAKGEILEAIAVALMVNEDGKQRPSAAMLESIETLRTRAIAAYQGEDWNLDRPPMYTINRFHCQVKALAYHIFQLIEQGDGDDR